MATSVLLLAVGCLGRISYGAWTPADLTVIEIKMTGSESIVIENTSASSINLSNYLLEYFNKSTPVSLAVPTSTQMLPAFSLAPGQTILINSDSTTTCGAAIVANETFSMSDAGGYLLINKINTQPGGSILYSPQDHVSWTSNSTGSDISKVPSNTADPQAVWYRKIVDGAWQQADLSNDCSVVISMINPSDTTTYTQWFDGTEPAVVVLASSDTIDASSIPSADIGLAKPLLTELLPNPASPQTDSEDEYIEIYNPNNQSFDLSGFKLQVGTTSLRTYTIPTGTTISSKGYKAFFSIDTSLSMSNSGGQVRLLDPLGTVIGQTDIYGSAKEGQAFALANGQWDWTSSLTPGGQNIINLAASHSKPTKGSSKSTTSVKAASTYGNYTNNSTAQNDPAKATVHPWTLAGVGAAALLYAGYEYRNDMANNIYRLRRYAASRRNSGK